MNGLGKFDSTVGRFVNYFEEDGIGGDQFSERASCVLPDGTLVFGGTHGLTWFNPLDVPQKRSVQSDCVGERSPFIHYTDNDGINPDQNQLFS